MKTVDEAKPYFERDEVEEASLDHDLGACDSCMGGMTEEDWLRKTNFTQMPQCEHFGTGYTLVSWMEETGHWPKRSIQVHSRNPAGRARMLQVIAKNANYIGELK